MSGRSLYPLTLSLAGKLSHEFDGKLRISYSGGADYHNIKALVDCGIWPVTMATTMLKSGGYNRLAQIAAQFDDGERSLPGRGCGPSWTPCWLSSLPTATTRSP